MAKGKDVRGIVILECTNCARTNVNKHKESPAGISRYITQKNRQNTPTRLELRKFCSFCLKHTIHGEMKNRSNGTRCMCRPFKGSGKKFQIKFHTN